MSDLEIGRTFCGYLKSISTEGLSSGGQQVFHYAFPWFHERPHNHEFCDENYRFFAALRDVSIPEKPTVENTRRFSGGASFPRGRYHSLAHDDRGDDRSTLLSELIAYCREPPKGNLFLIDAADHEYVTEQRTIYPPFISDLAPKHIRVFVWANDRLERDELEVLAALRNEPDVRSLRLKQRLARFARPDTPLQAIRHWDEELYTEVLGRFDALLSESSEVMYIDIPYNVAHVTIGNVIDLRDMAVQAWLLDLVSTEVDRTMFCYWYNKQEFVVPFLALDAARLQGYSRAAMMEWAMARHGECDAAVVYEGKRDWNRQAPKLRDDFLGLLSYLCCNPTGGSPVTEVIGRCLRSRGFAGLVYPSSRNDASLRATPDRVLDWRGFNFVDFRDAPVEKMQWALVIDPESHTTSSKLHMIFDDSDPATGEANWTFSGVQCREMVHFLGLDDILVAAENRGVFSRREPNCANNRVNRSGESGGI